jgi:F-type H+-transporting ATPase subunit b
VEIDFFTVIVQLINFAILLLLLRVFLYKPIINAMDAREARIQAQLQAAEQKYIDAQEHERQLQQEHRELQQNREVLMDEARAEAEATRRDEIERVRREAEEQRQRWQQTLEREKSHFLQTLRTRTSAEIFNVMRRALADLATVELEEHIVQLFIRRMSEISQEERDAITTQLAQADHLTTIRSAFELDSANRNRLVEAVRQHLAPGANARFEIMPELIGGIELRANGHVIRWSLKSYLDDVEQRLSMVLEESA